MTNNKQTDAERETQRLREERDELARQLEERDRQEEEEVKRGIEEDERQALAEDRQALLDQVASLRRELDGLRRKLDELIKIDLKTQTLRQGAHTEASSASEGVRALRKEVGVLTSRLTSLERHTGIKPPAPATQLVTPDGIIPAPPEDAAGVVAPHRPGLPAVPPHLARAGGVSGAILLLYLLAKEIKSLLVFLMS